MGTQELKSTVNGQKIITALFNIWKKMIVKNQVARDSNGLPENNISTLGTDTLRFSTLYSKNINVGSLGSESEISDSGNEIVFNFSDVEKAYINSNGFNYNLSSSCGAFAGSYKYITNLEVTIATRGRPIFFILIDDSSGNESYISGAGSDLLTLYLHIDDDFDNGPEIRKGTIIARQDVEGKTSFSPYKLTPVSSFKHIYQPAAGTYTFKMSMSIGYCEYAKLLVYEL